MTAKCQVAPLFTDTQCKIVTLQDISIHEFCNNVTSGWEIMFKKEPNNIIRPNLRYVNTNEYPKIQFKYFLTDISDLELIEKIEKGPKNKKNNIGEALKSLTSFSKHGKKNLYIRSIPTEVYGDYEESRLFTDDVIEVITIMIHRGAAKNKKMAERKLHVYRKSWIEKQTETTLVTISVEELIDILGIMDIDRNSLTIVEDPIYHITKKDMYEYFGYIRTCSPNCIPVVDKTQAIFMIFHSCVNGINWKKEECTIHTGCLDHLKSEIMRAMRKLAQLENGIYTYVYHILAIIEEIRVYCPARYKNKRLVLDYAFPNNHATDQLEPSHVLRVIEHYGLQSPIQYTMDIRVTVQRFFLQLYWVYQFFTNQIDEKLRNLVCNAICFLTNDDRYDFCKHHISTIFQGKMLKTSPFRISSSFPDEPKPPGVSTYSGPPKISNGSVSITLPKPVTTQPGTSTAYTYSSDSDDSFITEAPEFEPEPTEVEILKPKNLCINCNERKKRIKKLRVETGVLRKKSSKLQKKVQSEEEIEEQAKKNDIVIEGYNQQLLIKEEMIEERRFQGKSKELLMEANTKLIKQITEFKDTHTSLTTQKKEAMEKNEELEKENGQLEDRIKMLKERLNTRKVAENGEKNEDSDSKVLVLKESTKNKLINTVLNE